MTAITAEDLGRSPGGEASPARARTSMRYGSVVGVTVVVASILALWVVVADARLLGRSVLGPLATVNVIRDQWSLLWYNLAPTLTAAATGFAVTMAIGVAGLLVMVAVPPLSRAVSAAAVFLGVVPLVAVTPALSMLFSRGSELTALVTVLSGIIPVFAALARIATLRSGSYQELGEVYATSRWRWWREIGLWRSVPFIDFGVKAAVPACFLGTIVAEWAGASGDRGLGEVMVNAVFSFQAPLAWATIAISATVSLVAMGLVAAAMSPLLRRSRA